MTEGVDKKNNKGWREYSAADYVRGLKLLALMNEMAPVERVKDTLEYSEEHPYWHPKPEDRQKALAIMDAQMELLRVLFSKSKEEL